jgi:hypothetical protein
MLFYVHSAGLDEGVYIGAWLEANAFEIRLRSVARTIHGSARTQRVRLAISFHHFLPRESACSTQTRPSPAAIAMPRSCLPVVNRSSTQAAVLTIRRADVPLVEPPARLSARIRSGRRPTQRVVATARRHGVSSSSRRAPVAMARRVFPFSRVATSPCTARIASRPSAVPAARHGRRTAKSTSAHARVFRQG